MQLILRLTGLFLMLTVIAACSPSGARAPVITGVSPAVLTVGQPAELLITGSDFYAYSGGAVTAEACGAPLDGVGMVGAELRRHSLAPGVVVTATVARQLSGRLSAAAVPGVSDVVVSLADGTRLVLADAVECREAQAAEEVTVTLDPADASVLPGGSVTFTATVSGAEDTGVTWTMTGPEGSVLTADGITATLIIGTGSADHIVTATSTADPSVSASATVTVADRVLATLELPLAAPSTVTGLELSGDGRLALSLAQAASGEVIILAADGPSSGGRYGAGAFSAYAARPLGLTWQGADLLVVGASVGPEALTGFLATFGNGQVTPAISWLPEPDWSAVIDAVTLADGSSIVAGQYPDQPALWPDGPARGFVGVAAAGPTMPEVQLFGQAAFAPVTLQATTDGLFLAGQSGEPFGDEVPAGADDGFVMALTPELGVAWVRFIGGSGSDTVTTLAGTAGSVVAGGTSDLGGAAERGFVQLFDSAGGTVWTVEPEGVSAVTDVAASDSGRLYVLATGSGGDLLLSLAADGTELWRHEFRPELAVQQLVLTAAGPVVAGTDGNLWLGWLTP